jgi:hypothetical protein
VTNLWQKDFGKLKLTFKGPALLRYLHVLHGTFGSLEMILFFWPFLFLLADGKLGFRVISGYTITSQADSSPTSSWLAPRYF